MALTRTQNTRKISQTLTRRDLIKLVAKRTQKSEASVAEFVDVTIESLSKLIRNADDELRIELRGLGVFEVKFMKNEATVRDPRTGTIIDYEGRRRKVHFRPSKLIKRALQKEPTD
ncbi:histone family protein DNA-binding protein [Chloroherpeton thalassium ATCC 35110]|uniref:Histone family protein DNA-binding protein n=1 Tax=Chloroherpeton thalassium (strain ATCC 35110 / GB-78) TaxID=517418 RepID=B3QXA1_CHLT3|nr:HU family DNA-binding protein [Chloroherpeton thalassium]ACF13375.1 histone family protein DNA-binding protein [Chloroherpeton thalassium ATCC 35110]